MHAFLKNSHAHQGAHTLVMKLSPFLCMLTEYNNPV